MITINFWTLIISILIFIGLSLIITILLTGVFNCGNATIMYVKAILSFFCGAWFLVGIFTLCTIKPTQIESTAIIEQIDIQDNKLIIYTANEKFEINPKADDIDLGETLFGIKINGGTVVLDDSSSAKIVYDRQLKYERQIGPFVFKGDSVNLIDYISVPSDIYYEIFPDSYPTTIYSN